MKKLISILLAVSVMAASTMASAASLVAEGQRNTGSNNKDVIGGLNSDYLRDNDKDPDILAVYRPGDTLTFKSSDQTKLNTGDVLTFISSSVDATNYTDATVMFIDQVTYDSSKPLSYKIREGLAEGIYKMDIKIGSADVDTFYYSVGNPKVQVMSLNEDETLKYYYKDGSAQYYAMASIGSGDVKFEQAGVARFGFDFTTSEKYEDIPVELTTFTADVFDANCSANEIAGAVTFIFTIQLDDVEADSIPGVNESLVDGLVEDELN